MQPQIYYIYIIGGISLSYQKMKRYSWRQVLQGKYNRRQNCFLVNHKIKHIDIYLKDLRIKFHLRYPLVVIPELETLMLDILNCSSLISISSLNTFDFLLNSFFGYLGFKWAVHRHRVKRLRVKRPRVKRHRVKRPRVKRQTVKNATKGKTTKGKNGKKYFMYYFRVRLG